MSATRTTPFGAVTQVDAGVLNIGYVDAGPSAGPAVILLHGRPYDIHSYVDLVTLLTTAGYLAIVPYLPGYGPTLFLSDDTFPDGEQLALALDAVALLNALRIEKASSSWPPWCSSSPTSVDSRRAGPS